MLGFYLTLAIFPALILIMNIIPYLPIERVDEAIMDLLGFRCCCSSRLGWYGPGA